MGVLMDRPGRVAVDFQTAGGGQLSRLEYGVITVDGKPGGSVMSWRYYLQDSSFLVGFAGEDVDLLQPLHSALREPVWPTYLGRKSNVPSSPICLPDGLFDGDLLPALEHYPLAEGAPWPVRVVLDDAKAGGTEIRSDLPLDVARRQFGTRPVRVFFLTPST